MPNRRPGRRALLFIFLTVLIDVTGLGIIIPVMPELVQELTGRTVADAAVIGGRLIFVYALMQFLCAPIVGGLSDHFGRRPLLLLSLAGFSIDYFLMGFAPTLGWLFLGRILSGVFGATYTTAGAYIADVSPPEKRAQNFGLIGAAFGLGFIFGPVIGGLLGQFGPRTPFFAAGALALASPSALAQEAAPVHAAHEAPEARELILPEPMDGYITERIDGRIDLVDKIAGRQAALAKMEFTLAQGRMPPTKYLLLHWNHGLSEADQQALTDWIQQTRAKHFVTEGVDERFLDAEVDEELLRLISTVAHCFSDTEGFPSGQREQTVNLSAAPSEVRILPPPPSLFVTGMRSNVLPVLFYAEAGIAQLVEHQPSKLRVASSSLVSRSIMFCFLCPRNSVVEYLLGKEEVTGSSPVVGSMFADRGSDSR